MSQRVYGIYRSTKPTLTDGEIHPLLLDAEANLCVDAQISLDLTPMGQTLVRADLGATAHTAATSKEWIAATASVGFYVMELSLSSDTQTVLRLCGAATGTEQYMGTWQLAQRGYIYLPYTGIPHFISDTVNENLGLESSAGANISGHIIYYLAAL